VSGVLDDRGYEAEAEGGGVDHQQVVLRLNFGHDLRLAPPLPVPHDVGTTAQPRLVRVLKNEVNLQIEDSNLRRLFSIVDYWLGILLPRKV